MPQAEPSLFWWSWSVQLVAALATISAVLVALFGQAFRARFFPPVLRLSIAHPEGELTKQVAGQGGPLKNVRYYHLRVSNSRRWSPAENVQVVLLQVEGPGADRKFSIRWRGDIPVSWRHQRLFPIGRTIGAEADVDLCSVSEDRVLQLHPLVLPFNLEGTRTVPGDLILTLQARGNEADSPPFRVRLAWDGSWNAGEAEMRRHLVIEEAT